MAIETKPESRKASSGHAALKRFLQRHPVATFLLMGLSFLSVGLVSLNLVHLFRANIGYIIDYGVMGLREGGFEQFMGLLLSGYLGMALYVLFKVCEKVLVDRLLENEPAPQVIAETGAS